MDHKLIKNGYLLVYEFISSIIQPVSPQRLKFSEKKDTQRFESKNTISDFISIVFSTGGKRNVACVIYAEILC